MKYRMPKKVSEDEYVRDELELWQSGVLTGWVLGFLSNVAVLGLLLVLVYLF